ncbi:MAG: class I SAM-dependent methyltransferase [Pseudomonadota bacterium]
MQLDVSELRDFYLTPLGRIVRQIVSSEVRSVWPSAAGERVVGLGHATPYLGPFLADAERVVGLMPAAEGVLHWPKDGQNLTALSYEEHLPLPDNSVDKLLLIHLLEATRDPVALLREVWRVLIPTGRLLVVVPHRLGAWARADHTPFGIGRPFTRFQLVNMLADALLDPGDVRRFLCVPPSNRRIVLGSTRGWERIGRSVLPRFSGLLAVEAQKIMVRGIPAKHKERALNVAVPVLGTAPKPATRNINDVAERPPVRRQGSRTTRARSAKCVGRRC